MSNSTDTATPTFAKDLQAIRILSFSSYRKTLLYSGQVKGKFNNWSLAASFANANGMVPIETTEGGKYLSDPNRANLDYTRFEFKRIWDRASIKYCLSIEGAVKTFVCGAWDQSAFRRKEIPSMLRSKTIDEINGRDHAEYVRLRRAILARLNEEKVLPQQERHKRAINAVFRKIAFAEIRQDLEEARVQGNSEVVLARIENLREQHRKEIRSMPRPKELQKLSEVLAAEEEMMQVNPNFHLVLLINRHAYRF